MTITRKTHKQKLGPRDDNGNFADSWIEVERTDELIIETGSGHTYQGTRYKFFWPKDNNGDDDESDAANQHRKRHIITISAKQENNSSGGSVDLNIIDEDLVEFSRGSSYQGTRIK